MQADGVCYRDAKYGWWTATFLDGSNEWAQQECRERAASVVEQEHGKLPPDGRVVKVRLVEVKDA